MMRRLDVMPAALIMLKHPISSYLRHNLHYTISGFNFISTFLLLTLEVGIDRIMSRATIAACKTRFRPVRSCESYDRTDIA
jgi:uncharacterized protein